MEIWKDVNGFEGLYKISSYGRICSLERMKLDNGGYAPVRRRILKPQLNKDGYLMVRLFNNSKQLDISVHRLVALNFIPNPHKYLQVNHLDEIKTNNRVENLEWVTPKMNCNYGTKQTRFVSKMKNTSKFSKPVIGVNIKDGSKIFFPSTQEAKRNGFSQGNIASCCRGERKYHKGYFWHFANEEEIVTIKK